jgi:hypothetical protein
MARRARLQEFLGKRFADSKELRAFVDDTFGTDAVNSIGWEEGVNDETSDLIRWLESRGRFADLWPALRSAFPNFVAEIDALAAEWKPGPLTRFVPRALLHSRPVQVGVAAGVFAIAIGIWFLWFRAASYSAVVVLDGAARDAVDLGERFVIMIDGVPEPIEKNGVSIGRGPLLPRSIASAYRAELKTTESPRKINVRLTSSRAKKMQVFMGAKKCPTQPQIITGDHSLRIVKLDDCDPVSAKVTSPTPKPTIGVSIEIAGSEALRAVFKRELDTLSPPTTVEQFLTAKMIEQFEKIEMFEFVPASPSIKKEHTLVGRIETNWPAGDAMLQLKLGNEEMYQVQLFQTVICSTTSPCVPPTITNHQWYANAFQQLIAQWPKGFFNTIPLTETAIYETGGVVRTVEGLERFAQDPAGGPPSALFDISYGKDRRRTFILCHAHPDDPHKATGFDVDPAAEPHFCSNRVQTTEPGGRNGKVTLLKLLRVRGQR